MDAARDGLGSGAIDINDLVFIDEAGSKLGMSTDYARAEGGQRVVVKEPKNQGKNISLVAAMGLCGVVAAMYCLGAVDTQIFQQFVTDYLVSNLRPGQIVVMDNVSFHYSSSVRQAIESVGATLVFLPPYSPELSPIENMWSKVKSYLKSKMPKTMEDFHQALGEALNSVTEYDCEGWFDRCGYIQ